MRSKKAPARPEKSAPDFEPSADWAHRALLQRIRETLSSLPSFFSSELSITGVNATDLFSFNSSLGSTIESQVVAALNKQRGFWDEAQQYTNFSFTRQAQRFPDVTLRSTPPSEESVILGIELKGWYIFAKEAEPSFRYKVTPAVCAPQDLLVIVPWALDRVVSGSPVLFPPFVMSARYAAAYRNWHWEHSGSGSGDRRVHLSAATNHYPQKSDLISDRAAQDNGGNFGRIARTGLLDDYVAGVRKLELSGIPNAAWQRFFSIFQESSTGEQIEQAISRLETIYASRRTIFTGADADAIRASLVAIAERLPHD